MMKKQRKTTDSETPEFPHGVEFVLLPQRRDKPERNPLVPEAYDGYYQGYVRIVSCPRVPALENMEVFFIASDGRLPSCAPFHVYYCERGVRMNADAVLARARSGSAMIIDRHTSNCLPVRVKTTLDLQDMQYALLEAKPYLTQPTLVTQMARACLSKTRFPVPAARVAAFTWWAEHTSVGRVSLMGRINAGFLVGLRGKPGQKQRKRLAQLSFAQLQALLRALQTEPWELVWYRSMKALYGGVYPLTQQRYLDELRVTRTKPSLVVQTALSILWRVQDQRATTHDTVFPRALFGTAFPCLPRDDRAALERNVRAYLSERDIRYLDDDGTQVALGSDWFDASETVRHLDVIRERALSTSHRPFALRANNEKPALPPRLTADQRAIAQHITQHWLTVVLGSPGTGKTAIITWLLSHYRCAVASGFVGMLVRMLHRRNGRRPELAYTMDSFYYTYKAFPAEVTSWLMSFEVLVIDECSNVSMRHIRRLLPLFKRLRKVVFVGDTYQCKSLEAGAMLHDLANCFPQHTFRLTQNLRVAAELRALYDAPGNIVTGNWMCMGWGAVLESPLAHLTVSTQDGGMEQCLLALYAKLVALQPERGPLLLNSQILVLMHDGTWGRKQMNAIAQRVYERLGLLDPRQPRVTLRKELEVYAGCKVTFRQNYNHRVEVKFGANEEVVVHSDPVANGELVIVRRVWELRAPARGVLMEVVDSHDPDAPLKTVWVDSAQGVDPLDVDCGNATTVYKVQGREFPFVFFCVPPHPGAQWTRCNTYVAVSRAQERCVVLGALHDFGDICARPDVPRRTVFEHLLRQRPDLAAHERTTPHNEDLVDDPALLATLPAEVTAVPVLKDFVS